MKKKLLMFSLILMLSACKDEFVEVGKYSPDLAVVDLNGTPVNTKPWGQKKQNKQYTYLNFWSSSCGACMVELSHLMEMNKQYSDQIQIIAINIDPDDSPVSVPMQKFGANYTVLRDSLGITQERYQVIGTPTSFIIDDKGIVKQQLLGLQSLETLTELFKKITQDIL